jgi:hypothetical protein
MPFWCRIPEALEHSDEPLPSSIAQTSDVQDETTPRLSLDLLVMNSDEWSNGLSVDLLQCTNTQQAAPECATQREPVILPSENQMLDFDFSAGKAWTSQVTNQITSCAQPKQDSAEALPKLNGQHHDLSVLGKRRARYVHRLCLDLARI